MLLPKDLGPTIRRLGSLLLLLLPLSLQSAAAQTEPPAYARLQSFGVFAAWSNNSSHILMGVAEHRQLLQLGVSYSRRLFLNRRLDWQYDAELIPVALESDPLSVDVVREVTPSTATITYTNQPPPIGCQVAVVPFSFLLADGSVYSGTNTYSCHGRQWTMGEGMSPIGFRWSFRPRHALQPCLVGHGGYLYSTHAIPVQQAGGFNFTFDAGVGLELYRTHARSLRLDYRYHHISNAGTATENPGIDNGVLQLTYVLGR